MEKVQETQINEQILPTQQEPSAEQAIQAEPIKKSSKKCKFGDCSDKPVKIIGECRYCSGKFCSRYSYNLNQNLTFIDIAYPKRMLVITWSIVDSTLQIDFLPNFSRKSVLPVKFELENIN